MQSNNSVAEFLIELIKYADDEDIAVLLSNCNNKLTQNISVSNYKTALFMLSLNPNYQHYHHCYLRIIK